MPVAKRRYRRRRPKKVQKPPLSKREYAAVNKLINKTMYKNMESKIVYSHVDEYQIGSQLGEGVVTLSDGKRNLITPPARGDGLNQRVGLEVLPVSYQFKGHVKIHGSSSSQENRLTHVRFVFGYYRHNQSPQSDLSDDDILKFGTTTRALFGDFRDTYADINWNKFLPLKDFKVTLAPALIRYADDGTTELGHELPSGRRDVAMVNFTYRFKKGTTLVCESNNSNEWNTKNLACLMIARNVNDDMTTSILNVELQGIGKFVYKDP